MILPLFVVKNRIKYRNKCTIIVQKVVRGYLIRKRLKPLYKGVVKIKAIKTNFSKMEEIANQLRGEKDEMLKQVSKFLEEIEGSIQKIRVRFFIDSIREK